MSGIHRLVRHDVDARINPEPIKLKVRHLEALVREILAEVETLSRAAGVGSPVDPGHGINLREEVRRFEVNLIEQALRVTGGHQARAAALLGVKPTTLHMKIRLYGLSTEGPSHSRGRGTGLLAVGRRVG